MKIKWDPNHGISKTTHLNYLEEFGKLFYDSIKTLIDKAAKLPHFFDKFKAKDKNLLQEVVDHANFCVECVEKFHGIVTYNTFF